MIADGAEELPSWPFHNLRLSTHSFLWLILYLVYKIILPVTVNLMYELGRGDNSE